MIEVKEPLSNAARKVLNLAEAEALQFNHNYLGTEHLFLGLLASGDQTVLFVLDGLGIELEKVRKAVEFIIGRGERVEGSFKLTPGAEKVFELAYESAKKDDQREIEPIYILLALLKEGQGIATGVLESLGVNLEKVYTKLLEQKVTSEEGVLPGGLDRIVSQNVQGRKPDRFDKFTERARRVLTLAQEEARRLNHNYIGPEHLLLGLVREGEGVAAKALANLGASTTKLHDKLEEVVPRGDKVPEEEIGLTREAKRAIEFAVDEARKLGHHYIGTEHLFLGLLRLGNANPAGQVLSQAGITLESLRGEVKRLLSWSLPGKTSSGRQLPREKQERLETAKLEALKLRESEPIAVLNVTEEHAQAIVNEAARIIEVWFMTGGGANWLDAAQTLWFEIVPDESPGELGWYHEVLSSIFLPIVRDFGTESMNEAQKKGLKELVKTLGDLF